MLDKPFAVDWDLEIENPLLKGRKKYENVKAMCTTDYCSWNISLVNFDYFLSHAASYSNLSILEILIFDKFVFCSLKLIS